MCVHTVYIYVQREKEYIAVCEVPSLNHKIFNHPMEGASFVPISLLSCTMIFI